MVRIRKAVITAAGWGIRFLPVTKSLSKEMLPVINKPLIQYSIEEAIACGVEVVVIVTRSGKWDIEHYFDRSFELEYELKQRGEKGLLREIRRLSDMVDICYVHQKQPLGLGDAVLSTMSVVGHEPFMVLLPDVLLRKKMVLRRMVDIFQRYESSVIAVKHVAQEEVGRYGIIEPNKVANRIHQVQNLVEKPPVDEAPSDLAIIGRYILIPEIFQVLKDTPPGRNGEIQLTDALQLLLRQHPIYAYEFEGEHYDAGTPLAWLQTQVALALEDPDIGPQLRKYLSTLI